ncbi:membrane protein YIP1 [Trypanosoma conorhini]|uniref:Membrane protein YIP1 n=1 Tax=Trypanosoma conorhini TaxID=83891 RepID=A0A422NL03_9TRYP|nr:membrane protein YIP1 [Trypanosoma conorhini]RNF06170.1 membrane protein YIP1 [Trypanosoma conorhini]
MHYPQHQLHHHQNTHASPPPPPPPPPPQYQQPQYPQPASTGFFYQPYTDGGGGGAYVDQAPAGYHPHVASSHAFNGEEKPPRTHEVQHAHLAHVMSIGIVTPTISRSNSCVSPKAFGRASPPNSGSPSPLLRNQTNRMASPPPPPPPPPKPFLQQPSSSSIAMPPSPAPAFHEAALHASQPFNQSQPFQQQQLFQQQQPFQQQQQQQPPQQPRSGFVASMLNVILPHDAFGSSLPQGPVPLYQQRFGYPEDDLPLLEELGIFPHQIRCKALAVLNPFKPMALEAVEDMDLAGPVVFAITLAFLLSLQGKLQFSTIYGHCVLGIVFMKVLLSLMTDHGVALQFIISALGYCLIPNVILAVCQTVVYWLFGYLGKTMLAPAMLIVLWSGWCATAMLVSGLSMERQRYLILYPIFLFYAVFAALTIF